MGKESLFCTRCKREFNFWQSIPLLTPSNFGGDVAFSRERWEGIYQGQSLSGRGLDEERTLQSYLDFLALYRKDFSRGVFLDLGCGVAWTGLELAKKGAEFLGIDISLEALQKSDLLFQQEQITGSFLQADMLHLPLKAESIQFVYSCMGIEYVKDTQRAVDEVYRVLKVGGKFVAIVPVISLTTLTYHQLRGDIPNIPLLRQFMEVIHLKLFQGRYMHYGYEQSFTPRQLQKIFSRAGFVVKKIDYFPMYYSLAFLPKKLRPLIRPLLALRIFWPLVYIEGEKL